MAANHTEQQSLQERIDSPLLFIIGSEEQTFVHDTLQDFFLARWLAGREGYNGADIVEELQEDITGNNNALILYTGITKDSSTIKRLMELENRSKGFDDNNMLILLAGRCMIEGDCVLEDKELVKLTEKLIRVYDLANNPPNYRGKEACSILVQLARRYDSVIDILMTYGREYARQANIDEFNIDGFDFLVKLSEYHPEMIDFFEEIIRIDTYIGTLQSLEALSKINNGIAKEIIQNTREGRYHLREIDPEEIEYILKNICKIG